ncbi:N/A [soil metagenome]
MQEPSPNPWIVLAINDPELRKRAAARLAQLGHSVDAVDDGFAALEHICRRRPAVSVIDYSLAHLDGLEVLRRLKADRRTAALAVTMLVNAAHPDQERTAKLAGANACASKTLNFDTLIARIDRAASPDKIVWIA